MGQDGIIPHGLYSHSAAQTISNTVMQLLGCAADCFHDRREYRCVFLCSHQICGFLNSAESASLNHSKHAAFITMSSRSPSSSRCIFDFTNPLQLPRQLLWLRLRDSLTCKSSCWPSSHVGIPACHRPRGCSSRSSPGHRSVPSRLCI